ncbi:MAG: OmpA family protein [Cyclobacteriaceae bacterium]|nr:OmpA family protein [Cyclobacteriaceae bacterium]MCX7637236.1 OmpA family protein [Cyclobacteriaceae bacterium]MDW8331952.1 OmpA family protein [Cyclobacteriaceae bacterium]
MRSLLFNLLCFFSAYTVFAQHYYVVIGAFAIESNARKFTGYARNQRYEAAYEINPSRNLHYVYILKTSNRKEAFNEAVRLQTRTEFKDAWVFYGRLGKQETAQEPATIPEKSEVPPPDVVKTPEVPASKVEPVLPTPEPAEVVSYEPAEKPLPKPRGKYFLFRITTATGQLVPGEVHHVDRIRQVDIATYKTDQLVDISKPAEDRPLVVVCGIFGFKEVEKIIDYNNPTGSAGAVQGDNNEWIITYVLEPLKKGDVQVMYNVSFYKDAAIMTPQSKSELDELVNMMKLNPNYRIKIHGHCNGNYDKRLIKYPGKNKNYFSMTGAADKNGSSKELSRVRAETIKNYLIDNGIDKNRMEIFAWGGTNMLVSETSTSARLNDRIEIEILQD